jgi:hypothetical protein
VDDDLEFNWGECPEPISESPNTEDLVFDGPWDDTVRPAPLSLLPHLLATRMQLDNPKRSRAEILVELSALSAAELERRRDELRKPGRP